MSSKSNDSSKLALDLGGDATCTVPLNLMIGGTALLWVSCRGNLALQPPRVQPT